MFISKNEEVKLRFPETIRAVKLITDLQNRRGKYLRMLMGLFQKIDRDGGPIWIPIPDEHAAEVSEKLPTWGYKCEL